MENALVAIVAIVAVLVIGSDTLRERRRRKNRLDVPALLRGVHDAPEEPMDIGALVRARSGTATAERAAEPEGVWALLEDAVDLDSFRPKLAPGTEIAPFPLRWGDDYALIAKGDRSAHYELQTWEADLVATLDGSRTVGEVIVDHLERSGDLDVSAVAGLIESLRRAGVFDPAPLDVTALLARRMDPTSGARRRLRSFMKELKISWDGADRYVRWMYDHALRHLYRWPVLLLLALVGIVGLGGFISEAVSGHHQLVLGSASIETLVLIALGFVLTAMHEIGHATTLVHFDRKILSAGFILYYGSPAFFIDTSDGLMLKRGPRILQALAGPFAEFCLAGFSSLLLVAFPDAGFSNLLFKFSVLNYYVIFLNLIPLLELDGYWVLADAIEIPDLRPRSISFIKREMWQKLFRHEGFTVQEIGLGLYGVIGIAFTIFTSVLGLVLWREVFGGIVSDLWSKSVGTRILMIVLILFFAGPAIRGLVTLIKSIGRRIRAIVRRIRFRAETSWRVEAAEAIDALPAFDDIDVEVLNDLAGRVRLRTFARGDTVFRQGDPADAFYIVRRGTVAVEDRDPDTADTRTLRVLGPGEAFGEMGLLSGAPRQAAVRALEDIEVFRIDKNAFDRLLADEIDAPTFAPTMQAYADLRALPPFRRLGSADLAVLVEHGSFTMAAPAEVIVREGDAGDAFYVAATGRAQVVQGGHPIAEVGAGDHFGEIALLEDVPRTASVVATTPMRLFRLDREGFETVVAQAFHSGSMRRTTDRTWER
ncbi:MAG: cyclic nucleotide-binding domain-containing protein [Actinomycetota bacterium]